MTKLISPPHNLKPFSTQMASNTATVVPFAMQQAPTDDEGAESTLSAPFERAIKKPASRMSHLTRHSHSVRRSNRQPSSMESIMDESRDQIMLAKFERVARKLRNSEDLVRSQVHAKVREIRALEQVFRKGYDTHVKAYKATTKGYEASMKDNAADGTTATIDEDDTASWTTTKTEQAISKPTYTAPSKDNGAWLFFLIFLACAINSTATTWISPEPLTRNNRNAPLWPYLHICDWSISFVGLICCLVVIGMTSGTSEFTPLSGCAFGAKFVLVVVHAIAAVYYEDNYECLQQPSWILLGKAISSWLDVAMAVVMIARNNGSSLASAFYGDIDGESSKRKCSVCDREE